MRKMIRLIMFICLASAVTNLYAGPSEKRFEGEWVSHKDVDFGIHLAQDGDQLTGYHSAVTKDGSRTLHDRSLNWRVLQVKQSGEHYIPDKATLSKEH